MGLLSTLKGLRQLDIVKALGKGLWVTCIRKEKGILERCAKGNKIWTADRQREVQA